MTITTKEMLIEYLDKNPSVNINEKYFEWATPEEALIDSFEKIGFIKSEEQNFNQDEYWGKEAPIDFKKYPYFNIEIYKNTFTGNLYFKYVELGGSAAEIRIRLIRKHLIR